MLDTVKDKEGSALNVVLGLSREVANCSDKEKISVLRRALSYKLPPIVLMAVVVAVVAPLEFENSIQDVL